MEDKNVVAGEKEKARLAEEKVYSIETMIKDWANEKATAEKTKTECIWVDLDYDKPETNNKKNQSRYKVDEKFKQQVGDIINLAGATALDHKKKKLNDKEETLINTMGSPTHLATTCILEVTRNLTYTLSCGLKLSANFTANALFAQVQAGVELDLGVTREKGKQVRSSIEHKIERTVPGKHEAVCTLVAYGTPYKHEFTVAVELQGKVPVLFKNHVNYKDFKISRLAKNDGGHKLQFISIADIFQDLKTHNKLPKDLTCTIENGKVTCVINGEYNVEKVTTEIVMGEERPLAGATVATQPANTNQSQENKPVTNPANNPSGFFSSRTKDVGIKMPESLALHPEYQKTLQEKIRLTPTQVDELIKLIKLLENPNLKGQEEFIKIQITRLSDGQVDPNYKAQLDWIEKNPDKVHMLPSKTELQKESIGIDIYQTLNNYQAQLDWIEKNPDKAHLLPSKTELERNIIGLEVRQTTTSNPKGTTPLSHRREKDRLMQATLVQESSDWQIKQQSQINKICKEYFEKLDLMVDDNPSLREDYDMEKAEIKSLLDNLTEEELQSLMLELQNNTDPLIEYYIKTNSRLTK